LTFISQKQYEIVYDLYRTWQPVLALIRKRNGMPGRDNKRFRIKAGIFLMIFSGVFFGLSFVIPMFDFSPKLKVAGVTASLILMEVVFWAGGLLVGKELFTRYKSTLNPVRWFKRKKEGEAGEIR
jgi:hypothetical protein